MSFKLSSLLNPASPSPQPQEPAQSNLAPTPSKNGASHSSLQRAATLVTASSSDFDAAQALTAFATAPSYNAGRASFSSNPKSKSQYSSPILHQSAQASNSYPSAAPVEPVQPSPSLRQQPFSPTLEQYHHKSKSPEEQRRESFAAAGRNSPSAVLAPLQNRQQEAPGQDVSQIVPHSVDPHIQHGSLAELNEMAQHREPDYVRNEAVPHQIRAPGEVSSEANGLGIKTGDTQSLRLEDDLRAMTDGSHSNPPSPSDQLRFEAQAANPVHIKEEPLGSEPNSAPLQSPIVDGDMDEETKKAIEKLRNDDLGLRRARALNNEKISQSIEAPIAPPTGTLKKRPAPRTTAATKKGTAKKPPVKKRKTAHERNAADDVPKDESPNGAKMKSNGSAKNGTKSTSATPVPRSSPSAEQTLDDEEEDEDDGSDSGQLYCICRKPDNHTWMIACDGCEDWFHGNCVQMTPTDGELIAQYFCQVCSDAGKGRTLWKPMCRRKGCGKPANLEANSKYCGDDCGKQFFKTLLTETRREQRAAEKGSGYAERWRSKEIEVKERRKLNRADHSRNPLDSDSEDDCRTGARGGVIRPSELKALVASATTAQEFHALGDQLRSPPPSLSPDNKAVNSVVKEHKLEVPLLATEIQRMSAIDEEKEKVRARRALLKDREKFVAMTKDVVPIYAEREGFKPKENFCGYDRRHAWSEEEFQRWRETKAGKRAFRLGTIDPAAQTPEPASKGESDSKMELDGEDEGIEAGLCLKKNCRRHQGWAKTAREDVLFEIQTCATAMRALDAEENGIRERALERYRKECVLDKPV